MSKLLKFFATLGPLGYLPAPGTMGTVAAMPVAFVISFMSFYWQFLIIILLFAISYVVIDGALPYFRTADPSHIILDEVIGTLVTFYAISYNPCVAIIGFILFRLFDIFKPFGIRRLEKLPGARGILLDDVVAGMFANLILRLLFV